MPRSARIALTAAAIAAFVGLLVLGARDHSAVRCEVCVVYAGARDCRASRGETREAAIQGAHSAACANLTSGVTNAFRCGRTPAASVRCQEN